MTFVRKSLRGKIGTALLIAASLAGCGSEAAVQGESELADVSAFQQELLTDGVTYPEFERAILATMTCIEDKGISVWGPFPDQGGKSLSFDYGGLPEGASESELQAQDESANACIEEYMSVVSAVYAQSILPSETELQQRESDRRACAREMGYETPEDMGTDQFYGLVAETPELQTCIDRYP